MQTTNPQTDSQTNSQTNYQPNSQTTITNITRFNQIEIIPSSLIVFDIDETLIKFDGIDTRWWKSKFNKYYKQTQNYDLSEYLSHQEWIKIVSLCKPDLVDENIHSFVEEAKTKNCHIILLTARTNNLKDLTIQHIKDAGFSFEHIYFDNEKGNALSKIINDSYANVKNIIVVDDLKQNLDDINSKVSSTKYNLQLYNMTS
jgi:hypothetical protein